MSKIAFYKSLENEINRIDIGHTSKRNEKIIEGYTSDKSPKAIVNHKPHIVFNSNDYLGLRFDERLLRAEHEASLQYGTSPGAVRFISGSCKIYHELENAIATFHHRESSMLTSSAFAANIGVLHALIKGQSKDSLVSNEVLVLSDALNHRSIIDGIRVANLPSNQRNTYEHLNYDQVSEILDQNKGVFKRVVIITDGIFSMLGERVHLAKLRSIVDKYDSEFEQGVLLIVDDSHGVGAYGPSGRGSEDYEGVKADVLIGTLGKAFGADGGYITGDKILIDYLRESTATYIYSNAISPGVAGAALASINIMSSIEGKQILVKLYNNVHYFKQRASEIGLVFAADSDHPIQPILVADTQKTEEITSILFENGILVTNINYPIVPKGKDEIRIQLSASHQKEDIDNLIDIWSYLK